VSGGLATSGWVNHRAKKSTSLPRALLGDEVGVPTQDRQRGEAILFHKRSTSKTICKNKNAVLETFMMDGKQKSTV
jgi:hypothetical protein